MQLTKSKDENSAKKGSKNAKKKKASVQKNISFIDYADNDSFLKDLEKIHSCSDDSFNEVLKQNAQKLRTSI